MPFNAELLAALTSPDFEQELSTPDGITALNELLRAGSNANVFRKAIIDRKAFWSGLNIRGINQMSTVVDAQATDDNFLALGGNPNVDSSIANLLKHVVVKRVRLGLKNADEPFLLNTINVGNRIELRRTLAGADAANKVAIGDLTVISTWNPNNQDFIDDSAADQIWQETKRALLLKKIESCTVTTKSYIDDCLNAFDDTTYRNATTALGVPNMGCVDNTQEITHAAAKKGLSLEINAMPSEDVLRHGLAILNEANQAVFKRCFISSVSARYLDDRDINAIKGQLGARFLALKLASSNLGLSKDNLSTIAAETDVGRLTQLLKNYAVLTNRVIENSYIDHAVTAQTLPMLRQAAATQALKLSIATCDDLSTLEALIAAKTPAHIKAIITTSDSLGFKGNSAFRDAFTATSNVDDLVAAAHVRKSLSTAKNPDHLKELIDDATFINKYAAHFLTGESPVLSTALTTYFNKPENRTNARKESFIGYAKAKLSDTTLFGDVDLRQLVSARRADVVLTGAKKLLGLGAADTTADDLIPYMGEELRAYAAAEEVVRQAKTLNLSNDPDYILLTGIINNLNPDPQAALITTLPLKEQHALQARLTEVLATNYQVGGANTLVKLTNLAKAERLTDFHDALTALGIRAHDWSNNKSRVAVQKAACLSTIKLQVIDVSQFGDQAHPALVNLISSFSLEKQKVLLAKPLVLKALVRARDEDEVKRIVGDNSINAASLIAENKQLGLIAKIQNAEVAKILASIQPSLSLSQSQINAINTVVCGAGAFNRANYIVTVRAIANETTAPVSVFRAFSFDDAGTQVIGDQVREPIKAQKKYNVALEALAVDPSLNSSEKAVIDLCLSLTKSGSLTAPLTPLAIPRVVLGASEFTDFFTDFQASESAEQFINKANGPPFRSYTNTLNPSWQKQLTPEAFNEVKRTLQRNLLSSSVTYTATLAAQKRRMGVMASILEEIQSKDAAVFVELTNLGRVGTIEWLNPAFQAAAKQNAHKMASHFKVLAEGCNIIVTQYRHQYDTLLEEYKRLPTQTDLHNLLAGPGRPTYAEKKQMMAIETRRQELHKLCREVRTELNVYERVQKTLSGNPDIDPRINPLLHQGILKTLEQIKEGKKDIHFVNFHSSYKDYPMSKKEEHLRKGHQGEPAPRVHTVITGGKRDYYQTVEMVKAGQFREYTIPFTGSMATINSHFLEERDTTKNLVGVIENNGNVSYLPSIKLTASKFPSMPPPPTTITPEELMQAKVAYSLAMAIQALAGLAKPPSVDEPIVIDGSDPDEVRHLWSAFVAIGKHDPNMKFDDSVIKVVTPAFDPEDEKGRWYGLKSDSLYVRHYQNNPKVKVLTAGLEEANKNKVKNRDAMMEDTKTVSNFFKGELKQTLDKVKQENESSGPAPSL